MMTTVMPRAPVGKAWEEVSASFDRFCLAAGIETLGAMMEKEFLATRPHLRIPVIAPTRSDASRPPVPTDRDQCEGAVRCTC
jgi:hypothetical protein